MFLKLISRLNVPARIKRLKFYKEQVVRIFGAGGEELSVVESVGMANQYAAANAELHGEDPNVVGGILYPERACPLCGKLHKSRLHSRLAATGHDPSRLLAGLMAAKALIPGVLFLTWSWFVVIPLNISTSSMEGMTWRSRLMPGTLVGFVYMVASVTPGLVGRERYAKVYFRPEPWQSYVFRILRFVMRSLVILCVVWSTVHAWNRGLLF